MLILLVRFIYVDYHQFVAYDSKHILSHKYKWYSIYSSFIAEISQNQDEYTGRPYVLWQPLVTNTNSNTRSKSLNKILL